MEKYPMTYGKEKTIIRKTRKGIMGLNTKKQKSFYQVRLDAWFDYATRHKQEMEDCEKSFDRLQKKSYQHVGTVVSETIKRIYNGASVLWKDLPCESFFYVDDPYNDNEPVKLRDVAVLALGYYDRLFWAEEMPPAIQLHSGI